VSDVVIDADGEVVLRLRLGQLIEHGLDHGRSELLAGEAVTPPDDLGFEPRLRESVHHVEIERFSGCARFLGAVEHRQGPHRLGEGGREVLDAERPVQPDFQHPHLLPPGRQVLHGLVGRLRARTHKHDHALDIGGADIVEEVVFPSGERREPIHILLHHLRAGQIVPVDGLPALEVHVWVLAGAPQSGTVGCHGPLPDRKHVLLVDHGPEHVVTHELEPLHLVGGTEAVAEVDEGDPRLECRGGAH